MSLAATSPQTRRLSIAALALIVPWVALAVDAWGPIGDTSFLWHIRAGSVQIENGAVLTTDPFSFTMGGETWLTQSWLVELLYAWMEGFSGLGFVPFMIVIVGGLTLFGVALLAYRYSESVPATAFVLVLSTLVLISFIVPRPVVFSYLLMVLAMLAWDRPSTRWALPFIFWIWASAHASFLIGLAYVGIWLIIKKEWKWLPTAILSGLVTLGTAHGLGVLEFLMEFGANREALEFITEWRKPELLDAIFLPFLGGIVFIVIGAFRKKIEPKHLLLIVPFTILAMTSLRAIPPAWLGIVPLVALSLQGLRIGSRAGMRLPLAAVFIAVVLVLPLFLVEGSGLPEERFPIEAKEHLSDAPTFHDDRVGGYLIWAEGPGRQIYFDDRAELYGPRMEEFVKVRNLDIPWEPIFERDGVEQVLLESDEELIPELESAGWEQVYTDEAYTVLQP